MSSATKNYFFTNGIGVLGGVVAATIALLFAASQPRTFPLDDAYIHLAYGKSLAFSGTLGLNPGESSLGTSSPLWALVLVPLFWIFRDPYWSLHTVSLLSVLGYIVLSTRLLDEALAQLPLGASERRVFTALGALLLAANGSLLWMSLSGMETCLVLFLCVATITAYTRFGPGLRAGAVLGFCVLGRSTSFALIVAIIAVELLSRRRYRQMVKMLVCAGVIFAPYALYSWHISGSIFPNTAKGKLLTYVSGGFNPEEWGHYWGRALALHKYLLAYPLLGVAMLVAWVVFRQRERRSALLGAARDDQLRPIAIFGLWSIVHVLQYTIAFRTIGQQGRYLAEWLLAVAMLGTYAVAYCATLLPQRGLRLGIASLVAAAHLSTLPYWESVYRNNLAHVANTYVRMAEYIRNELPKDARVASFDIGTIRYVGDRYTIDLVGLVDASTHQCLKERACGEYLRKQGATHIMYPKDPEADKLTGVQQAEFAARYLLREVFVKQFDTPDYSAPTLTHSFRLQLFRVDGWFDRTQQEQVIAAFQPTPATPETPFVPSGLNVDGDFEVVGYRIDIKHDVTYIREYPYTFTVWLQYRALTPPRQPKWMHVLIFDDEAHRQLSSFDDLVTEGVILPNRWPAGKIIEEHRVFDLPTDQAHSKYHLLISVTDERIFDHRYPELYQWVDLGVIHVERSKTTALSPL